jgi:uncharacterized membrane protein
MSDRDTLAAEVGAALAILGLLLVFLPLFLDRVTAAAAGRESQKTRRARVRRTWAVPVLMAIAALDATLGLLTLWGTRDAATATGVILAALVWLVVALAVWTVRRSDA